MNKCIVRKCNHYAIKGFRKCINCINSKCIECGKKISKNRNLCFNCKVKADERTKDRSEEE